MTKRSSYRFSLLGLVPAILFGVLSDRAVLAQSDLPGPDQNMIQAFLETFVKDGAKTGWTKQDRHLSGKISGSIEYSVHRYIETYSSMAVTSWLPGKKSGGLADGAVIVALEYDAQTSGTLRRAVTMVRHKPADGPADGWFWSSTVFTADGMIDSDKSKGEFGNGACFGCHGSASNDGLVFLNGKNGPFSSKGWDPKPDFKFPKPPPPQPASRLMKPLNTPNLKFLKYFGLKDVVQPVPFPAKVLDHVWARNHHAAKTGKTPEGGFVTSDQCLGCHNAAVLLSDTSPNMWYAEPDPDNHLLPNNPDKKFRRNFSPYGEWSASINALSGRDPAWHAQVDFERRLRPALADFTTSTCFSCHGAMATRQLQNDLGNPLANFTIDMFYATGDEKHAKYGALARDGVSCAVCHQISANNLGDDPDFKDWDPKQRRIGTETPNGFFLPSIAGLKSYTAMFDVDKGPKAKYWGPYRDPDKPLDPGITAVPMRRVLGRTAGAGPLKDNETALQIKESKLCGSCHTVLVPALPVDYKLPNGITNPFLDPQMKMSFEQTTYFEWRNSAYENEKKKNNLKALRCQNCHMASHANPTRIVNAESDRFPPVQGREPDQNDFKKHTPYPRHVLLGINYFVFEMYEQFPELLGTKLIDARVPSETVDSTVNARDWIENHAENITADTRITKLKETGGNLEVTVQVTNYAGHKFPTGAGFRRAFIDFEVLDAAGKALWWSGKTDALGVIVGADEKPLLSEETIVPAESQPHHKVITRQDQVQIYETRALNSNLELQTTVLGIYYEYKDNRILPLGFTPPVKRDPITRKATAAVLVGTPDGSTPPAGVSHEADEHPTVTDYGTRPYEVVYDPDYWLPASAAKGQDNVLYKVPLSSIPGWKSVRAQLRYQTIPPYYLRDRFQTDLPKSKQFPKERDMNRLIYMASRLNLAHTPAEGWSLKIGPAATGELRKKTQLPLTPEGVWKKLKKYHKILDRK